MSEPGGGALIIKTGDLGAFVHALPAMRAVREAYRGQRIVLLSNAPVDRLAVDCPYFDSVDAIEDVTDPRALALIGKQVSKARFDAVFDLDRSSASEKIFAAAGAMKAKWSGHSRGAKFRFSASEARGLHPIDAYLAQVAAAGVPVPNDQPQMPDAAWAATARRGAPSLRASYFSIAAPYVVLAPAVTRDGGPKRWPASRFAGLASRLTAQGVAVVLYTQEADRETSRAIVHACKDAKEVKDLSSRADLTQIASLGAGCAAVVGHQDTPLTHLLAAAGARTISIGPAPERAVFAPPRGRAVVNLETDDAAAVEVEYVASLIRMVAGVGGAASGGSGGGGASGRVA